ncbi:MAG TPA: hypothetical protein VMT60_02530, partial [Candidatus Bathyarchaeia archaeon]|nr:hypothetical protein [Candidatus Bathyarchaeia archaeon]
MSSENLKSILNSRYALRRMLGEYPPWHGYSVADSLSEREYLLFSLETRVNSPLSIYDLRMRDYLFSRSGAPAAPTLSLQHANGSLTFLLPHTDIVPLTKALSLMKPARAAGVMETILSYILARLGEGLCFHNLRLESLCMAADAPAILPVAYLLPGETLHHIAAGTAGADIDEPYADLRAVGRILAMFAKHLDRGAAETAGRLSEQLEAIGPETSLSEYDAALEALEALAGDARPKERLAFPTRQLATTPPPAAVRALKQIALRARDGEKQLAIVAGARGEGRTHFLEFIARRLTEEWGFRRGTVASDLALYQDPPETDAQEQNDFALLDDRGDEPLLSCHAIDYVCQAIERCNLVVIATDAGAAGLTEQIRCEFSKREIAVRELSLSVLSRIEKRRVLSSAVRSSTDEEIAEALESSPNLALARLNLIAPGAAPGSGEGGSRFLEALSAEERSVLGILAVFGFEAPLSFLLGIFAPEENQIFSALERLVARGLVRSRAEISTLSDRELCAVYRPSSLSVARAVLEGIPVERRESIHRSIARLLGEKRGVPAIYAFYHLARSGAREEAA